MELYIHKEDHDLFLNDSVVFYQTSDLIRTILNQIKLLANVQGIALYMLDDWSGKYLCVREVSKFEKTVPKYLPPNIINKVESKSVYFGQSCELLLGQNEFKGAHLQQLTDHDALLGYIVYFETDEPGIAEEKKVEIIQLVNDMKEIIVELKRARRSTSQGKKYEVMSLVVEKLHSSMNPVDVLRRIIKAIESLYPVFTCELYLPELYSEDPSLPIKELIFNEEYQNEAGAQAFLTGKLKSVTTGDQVNLYAPLNGKQGVYGVLHLSSDTIQQIPVVDIDFIRALANTAGNALENARMYAQSNRLIVELQLINAFAHELNKFDQLSKLFTSMKEQFQSSFQVEQMGFILFNKKNKMTVAKESTELFHLKTAKASARYLLKQVRETRKAVFISDSSNRFNHDLITQGSLILLPMVHEGKLIGMIIVTHSKPNQFTFNQYKLMISLMQHATLAVDNIILKERLEESAITDFLTKLYSREYLDNKCRMHLKKDSEGVLMLLDLDDFKSINDSYGHHIGDQVLVKVANILKSIVRKKGFVSRWGGEEFLIYLPELNLVKGEVLAQKVIDQISQLTKPRITASLGVVHWVEANQIGFNKLLYKADRALYEAKGLGKNRYIISNEEIK